MWAVNYFHLQILVLELLFCMHFQKRSLFLLRLVPGAVLYAALPFIVPGGYFSPFVTWNWFTFGFMIMFVLSGLLLWSCFRMNVRQVVFYCCVAHTVQHTVHCLVAILNHFSVVSNQTLQLIHLLLMLIACCLVWRFLRERFRGSETADIRNGYLVVFALVSTLIIYVISYWGTAVETGTVSMQFFDMFSCLLLLVILLDMFRLRRAEREQIIMQRLLRQEQEQHEISRATIDVINRKCHDLRHQIAALRHMSEEEQEKSIGELERAVLIYDSLPKSGNEDVDIILAEKSFLAEEKHVALRSVVDGRGLSFMKVEDLYALLGNALDNALEGAAGEKEEGRRIITMYAAQKGNLFSIHIENPCETEPLFMDGLPVTNKKDRDYHGYGMRSMKYLCEKYHGALTCSWDEGVFQLDILFPREMPPASEN